MKALSALVALGVLGTFTLMATPAAAEDVWTAPFPGIRHLHRTTTSPARNINVLSVDLCAPGVSFRATKESEKGKKTSAFGALVGASAAVNGDFYKSGFGIERGIAVGDGSVWNVATPDDTHPGQLAIGANRVEIIEDDKITTVQPWMKNVVGGRPSLLESGFNANTTMHPNLCVRNPRTAVGLTKDKKTLLLAVVDGRASTRVGMSCDELTALMKELGAHDALNFDGGGSSTMWISGQGVVNHPSDGTERTVSNHLAIFATGKGPATACPAAANTTTLSDDEGNPESAASALGTGDGAFASDSNEETAGCNVSRSTHESSLVIVAVAGLFIMKRRTQTKKKE